MYRKIKLFCDTNLKDLETAVNNYIENVIYTSGATICDIKFSTDEKSFNVMIIYMRSKNETI